MPMTPVLYSWVSPDAIHPGESDDAMTETRLFDGMCNALFRRGIDGKIVFTPDKKRRAFAVESSKADAARELLHEYVRQGVFGIAGTAVFTASSASEAAEKPRTPTFF